MMVQLTAAREFCENLSVLVALSSNSSTAILLRFKLHEPYRKRCPHLEHWQANKDVRDASRR